MQKYLIFGIDEILQNNHVGDGKYCKTIPNQLQLVTNAPIIDTKDII